MAELGIDISHYHSQSLRVPLVEEADFIFTMTRQQQDAIHAIYPAAAEKTFVLREFEDAELIGKDISDPIGQSIEVYRRTRDQIRNALPSIVEFIRQTEAGARKTAAEVSSVGEPLQPRRIALGADHGGYQMKEAIKDWLAQNGYQFADFGTHSSEPVDYPEYAFAVAREVVAGNFDRGLLICKSGIGMSIAANRISGARAALVGDEKWARLSREHNDANILVLSGLDIDIEKAKSILDVWLNTKFEGGRHERRVKEIDSPPLSSSNPAKKSSALAMADPETFDAVQREKRRQQENIELIASENFTSPANTPKGIPANVTTVAANTWTSSSSSPSTARSNCSGLNTPMSSRTAAARRTWRCILRRFSWGTRS
jgi:RpiB/LacA/LacB family sugar-phosphate isomerase